ncbi:hypothetical protein JCM18382A_30630 [Bradyrhizobium sp. 17-4]
MSQGDFVSRILPAIWVKSCSIAQLSRHAAIGRSGQLVFCVLVIANLRAVPTGGPAAYHENGANDPGNRRVQQNSQGGNRQGVPPHCMIIQPGAKPNGKA